jgi:hypothetical protein
MDNAVLEVKYSDYKGHPLIEIPVNSYQGKTEYLRLGLKKCKILLSHMKTIEEFVNSCGGS